MQPQPYLRLSELNSMIRKVVQDQFSGKEYWVVADITNHAYYKNSDRHYMILVEKSDALSGETAKISAKAWSEGGRKIKEFETSTGQKFTDGIQVLLKVSIDYHILYGLSLSILDVDISFTLGNLERQRRLTLERLVRDNPDFISKVGEEYITRNKKLLFPPVLQYLAVVASPNSAGFEDFNHTLLNNKTGYRFKTDFYFATVQGTEAEGDLVEALRQVYNSQNRYDAVVMIRGGGSKMDFLVYDTYSLSRATAKFPIPIITGIGHLKDISIVDMMVHSPTKTPTQAAEFILAHNRNFEEQLLSYQKNILITAQQRFSAEQQLLNAIQNRIVSSAHRMVVVHKDSLSGFYRKLVSNSQKILMHQHRKLGMLSHSLVTTPRIYVNDSLNQLQHTIANLKINLRKNFKTQKGYLDHFHSLFKMIGPENTLKRGFAIVYQNDKIIKDSDSVETGSEIRVELYKAELTARVLTKRKRNEKRS